MVEVFLVMQHLHREGHIDVLSSLKGTAWSHVKGGSGWVLGKVSSPGCGQEAWNRLHRTVVTAPSGWNSRSTCKVLLGRGLDCT